MAFLAKNMPFLGSSKQIIRLVQTSAVQNTAFRKWAWNAAGYQKYGLHTDDLMSEEMADVAEAVRRLPNKIVDERNYRMLRAIQLSIQKAILPKNEWTKYEEDKPYLQSYISEVVAEREEREAWDRTH